MAGNSRMHVEGDKELMALLMGLGKKANAINRAAVNKAGTPALQEAKANCPVDKGDLKKSLVKKTTNKGPRSQAKIGADADYVDGNGEKPSHYDHLVENGRVTPDGIHVPAQPFMRNAGDSTLGEAERIYGAEIAAGIDKAAGK